MSLLAAGAGDKRMGVKPPPKCGGLGGHRNTEKLRLKAPLEMTKGCATPTALLNSTKCLKPWCSNGSGHSEPQVKPLAAADNGGTPTPGLSRGVFSWLLLWQRLEPTIKIHFKLLQSESSESLSDSVAGAVQDQGFSPIPN